MPCVLSPDAVYIWCQETETLDRLAVEKARAHLTAEERARCDRFRFPHDRRDYAVAHDLLRRSLNGLERDGRTHCSSISHARGVVACAIASGMPVGVDVERVDPASPIDDLIERHCDTVCFHLFDRTPHAWGKVALWHDLRAEFVKRAAFALLASLALHDKNAADEQFVRSLPLIERAASDDRNFVKKGVSWALRLIGRRNAALNAHAVKLARRLSASPLASTRWIGKGALKELTSPLVMRHLRARRRPASR